MYSHYSSNSPVYRERAHLELLLLTMARILKTFQSNPALGGFGNESGLSIREGDCDAFAQIVKELVDNAVDSCRKDSEQIRRVRVDFTQVSPTVLRVTVSDNGCGMSCIQDCVEAFRSDKGESTEKQSKTAGRYGIGLTLCLLHAQRLVPNSTASISSATQTSTCFQTADYVVDTDSDCVKCIPREETPKSRRDESGTSVSVLVPGGPMAHRAWPRLAEYFARFQLSLGLPCSLEVMAPTLSTVPLFVRSPLERRQQIKHAATTSIHSTEDDEWGLKDAGSDSDSACSVDADEDIRMDIQRAVSGFLRCNVDLKNVAHSKQPIRNGKRRSKTSPTLEVDMIVYEKRTDNDDNDEGTDKNSDMPSARMTLVRMVNRIPILDGAEASACGLVQCVATKQSMWSSFGLSASHGTDLTATDLRLFVPTYAIRDSDSVASFFQNRSPHQLFELQDIEHGDDDQTETENGEDDQLAHRPKNRSQRSPLLPAHLRLGNILVVIQIHAHPSSLPLPTLSKSRLPLNDIAIDSAVEAGVVKCLQSLQKTNPALLLTPMQLKTTIRDTRYIPSAAAAMACVICKSKDEGYQKHYLKLIRGWTAKNSVDPHQSDDSTGNEQEDRDLLEVAKLGPLLEAKLREICVATDGDKTRSTLKKAKGNRMITRSSIRGREVPSSTSPLPLETSESWGCMSPSPVKVPRQRFSTSMEERQASMSSLDSQMPPSPVKKATKTTKAQKPPRKWLDSFCKAFDERDNLDNQTICSTPHILTLDDEDYSEVNAAW